MQIAKYFIIEIEKLKFVNFSEKELIFK